jgi:oligoendopeptidase F
MNKDIKTSTAQPGIENLQAYKPREFVPEDAVLTSAQTVTSLFERLIERQTSNQCELLELIKDYSELCEAIGEARAVLYIKMTCRTDDPQRAKAYRDFVENVSPVIKPLADRLDRKIVELADKYKLNDPYYDIFLRDIRSDLELFREENIALQTQDSLLSQEYQSQTGKMTVSFKGEEYPIASMAKFLEETHRPTRQQAWQAIQEKYLGQKPEIEDIFAEMVKLRHQIALNAGFDNYVDFIFKAKHRFNYTPADCREFHAAVKEHFVPVVEKMQKKRKSMLGVGTLRPWDLIVDPAGREPLRPFKTTQELIDGLYRVFACLDGEFSDYYRVMMDNELLDLENRKGKAPGGYQSTLPESRKPFIFMNAIGSNADLRTLMHESGHAFHAISGGRQEIIWYRHAPLEFCEVASMGMELISASRLDAFYDGQQQKRWWADQLELIARLMTRIAVIDAFQHWIYANPTSKPADWDSKWAQLSDEYGGEIDYTGFEQFKRAEWIKVMHFFCVPLYYIEYGIAQLGALGLYQQSLDDMQKAVKNYKNAISLGGSKPLAQLFEAAGLEFGLGEKTVKPAAEFLLSQWRKYTDENPQVY